MADKKPPTPNYADENDAIGNAIMRQSPPARKPSTPPLRENYADQNDSIGNSLLAEGTPRYGSSAPNPLTPEEKARAEARGISRKLDALVREGYFKHDVAAEARGTRTSINNNLLEADAIRAGVQATADSTLSDNTVLSRAEAAVEKSLKGVKHSEADEDALAAAVLRIHKTRYEGR